MRAPEIFPRQWGVAVLTAVVALGLTDAALAASAPPIGPAIGAEQTGRASWYGANHHGRVTASGETFDMHALTAAHPTLPLGSLVRVTNLRNGRWVEVRINDRGPTITGRVIDLSRAAAAEIRALAIGVIQVRVRVMALPGPLTVSR